MSTCMTYNTADEARRSLRAGYRIEGCQVDEILETVYRAGWDQLALKGLDLRTQIISWDRLCVAADRLAIVNILESIVRYVAANTAAGVVDLRSFPSHDDVHVVFEVQNERPARRCTDRVDEFDGLIERVRMSVESMGGEVAEYSTEDGGSRVSFRLAQWI